MNPDGREAPKPAAAHDETHSDQCEQERPRERRRPIGAAQLAAPSTRRWRRPERPDRPR